MLNAVAQYQAQASKSSKTTDASKGPIVKASMLGPGSQVQLTSTQYAIVVDLADANEDSLRQTKNGAPFLVYNLTENGPPVATFRDSEGGITQRVAPVRANGNINLFF